MGSASRLSGNIGAAGTPIGYKLVLENTQTLLGLEGSPTMTRAGFASKNLWVTPYHVDEQWPGGACAPLSLPLENQHRSQSLKIMSGNVFSPRQLPNG